MRPATRLEGYAVQALIEAHSGAPLFGWKIAATSAAGQKHINVDGPLAGRLLRKKAHASGVSLPLGVSSEGLPIGVQLAAQALREDVLVQVSAQLETAMPWADRRPATWVGATAT